MGIEGRPFDTTPLRRAATEAAARESRKEPIETEIDGKEIKIFPREDGSFTVYVEDCPFRVENNDGMLESTYDATNERNNAWKAPKLQPLAIEAVNKNYFPQ